MQDMRRIIDIVAEQPTPQVGDAIDLEFGDNTAVISTTIEKIGENSVTVIADDKALDFISKLEEVCGCEMEEEHEEEHPDHEVNMGRSQMYHTMKNAKAIHDMLQKVSEREGIEGWVASKLTKASDYLKVVKDYLEYEMVQAGFDNNEQDVNEAVDKSALEAWYNKYKNYEGSNGDELPAGMLRGYIDTGILSDGAEINEYDKVKAKYGQDAMTEKGLEPFYAMMPITKSMHEEFMKVMGVSEIDEENCTEAAKILGEDIVGFGVAENTRSFGQAFEAKYKGKTVKLGKPIRTGTDEPGKFKVYVKDPKTKNVKMVRFGHQGGGKNKDSKTMRIKKSDPARRKSFRARHNCDNPGPRTKARYWSCRAW
tara:strand:- start:1490 stop:2593 length:1104 start_codon:yes stop_codon:yes gene_type:complete